MTNFRIRRGRVLVAGLAAASLLVAACGDDKESTTTSAAPATTAASETSAAETTIAAPTGPAIKIGMLIGLTGSKADAAKASTAVAQGWVDRANATGGINGSPVELIIEDTKQDPATAQAAATKLVEQDEVVGIFLDDSQIEGAVKDYLATNNVPVFGSEGYNTQVWAALPTFITYWTSIPGTIYASPYVAKTLGAQHFAAFSCAEVAACAQAEAIYKPAAEGLGMEWSGLLTVAGAAPDYNAECLAIIDKGVDFVILSIVSSVAVRVVSDCLKQGYTGYFGSTAGGFEQALFETVKGAKVAGALHGFPWFVDAQPVNDYLAFVDEYAPGAEIRTGDVSNMYAGWELFGKAAANVDGQVTRDNILDGYDALDGETLDGLLAQPFEFTKGTPMPKVICYWPYELDTTTGEITLLEAAAESGNGVDGVLSSSCVTELKP